MFEKNRPETPNQIDDEKVAPAIRGLVPIGSIKTETKGSGYKYYETLFDDWGQNDG